MSKYIRWWDQWRTLATWERLVLVGLAWRLDWVWMVLRLAGLKKTMALVEKDLKPSPAKRIPAGMSDERYSQRCAQLAEIAARHGFYRANCLHQSLALCSLLRFKGLPAHLRIGVLPKSKPLEAHAWVELGNVALGTQPVDRYLVFEQLDPSSESFHFR